MSSKTQKETYLASDAVRTLQSVQIKIRVDRFEPNTDGTLSLFIEVPMLSNEVQTMLNDLFPHTIEQIFELLNRELLLSSIVRR